MQAQNKKVDAALQKKSTRKTEKVHNREVFHEDRWKRETTRHQVPAISGSRSCSGDWLHGIAGSGLIKLRSIGHQLSSAKYDHNDRTGCSGRHVRHTHHASPIDHRLTGILPRCRLYDANQRLAYPI
jgi:hypothetical protein